MVNITEKIKEYDPLCDTIYLPSDPSPGSRPKWPELKVRFCVLSYGGRGTDGMQRTKPQVRDRRPRNLVSQTLTNDNQNITLVC